jgi:hypothetical protein
VETDLLLVLDVADHNIDLLPEIDAVLLSNEWTPDHRFHYAYTRTVKGAYTYQQFVGLIATNVELAIYEAEWEDIRYLYAIGTNPPDFGFAHGH